MRKLLAILVSLMTFAGLAPSASAQDVKQGEKKADMCMGCHNIMGYQASFPEVHKVPKISGQNAKYIVAALTAYKKGERRHPTMRAIATSLTDADMADLAAFYEAQPGEVTPAPAAAPAPERVADLLKKTNCASCHGENFSKPIDGAYPKLAGQHADYLFVALKSYQVANNPHVGRGNAIMAGMARQYTTAELKLIAQYLSSLPGELQTVQASRFR